ncbi:Metal binding domain of Ada [Chitinophaga jiangningensis]|uniref:Metal binding domain of Ada n=1 Tax=Chitinophaga jiangningensis TaxID=1419482 RepID=A0A1M6VS83_9BACT|nr:Ada metal-binding domain-containing protein [Chitinophaga jiangningensis]SHK84241.1 Metal binding domain of Ada [Chitinophaga jiangningensis]
MIHHQQLGTTTYTRSKNLLQLIRTGAITIGGNKKLKIYGTLQCSSGKRMKTANRVFFRDEQEALQHGYRACKRCLKRNVPPLGREGLHYCL